MLVLLLLVRDAADDDWLLLLWLLLLLLALQTGRRCDGELTDKRLLHPPNLVRVCARIVMMRCRWSIYTRMALGRRMDSGGAPV